MIRMSDIARIAIVIVGVSAFWALAVAHALRAPALAEKQAGAFYMPAVSK